MESTTEKIDVQFRVLKGTVIAVFPFVLWNTKGDVTSFVKNEGHGAAAWNINTFTKPAKPEQFADLKKFLEETFDYEITVIKRRNHKKYLQAYKPS